jgi:hypothetical protein
VLVKKTTRLKPRGFYHTSLKLKKISFSGQKLLVRGMNAQRFFTFKSFDQDELQIEDFNEYYEDNVQDTDKFEKVSSDKFCVLLDKFLIKSLAPSSFHTEWAFDVSADLWDGCSQGL